MNKQSKNQNKFLEITQTFLKLIRGNATQEIFSEGFNKSFNISNRWESGRRQFYWIDFLEIARKKQWDVGHGLKEVSHFDFSKYPDAHQFIEKFLTPTATDILKSVFSSQKLNRLASARSKLVFSDFLVIIEILYGRSQRFLNVFLDKDQQLKISKFYHTENDLTEMAASNPIAPLIQMALSLKEYKNMPSHSNSFFTRIIDCNETEVDHLLKSMQQRGLIEKINSHYKMTNNYIDTGANDRNNSKKIANYWRKKISQAAEENLENGKLLSAYIMYATNQELESKIFELSRKFYMDVKNLVSKYE